MKNIILVLLILTIKIVSSQTYETRNKVYIPKGTKVIKSEKAKKCKEKVLKNSIVKYEYTKSKNGRKYIISKTDTINSDTYYKFDKKHTIKLNDFSGWVNIKPDEKDKSKLHINPWLSKESKVLKSKKIRIVKRTIDCKGSYKSDIKTITLKKDTIFRLLRVKLKDTISIKSDWFVKSNTLIEVLDDKNSIEYYLVNKYDQNADFYIKLKNRDFVSLTKRSVVFGPVTIPFKYRFKHKKKNIGVESEFIGDFNVGVFVGKNWGRYRVRYENKELKKLSNLSFTLGSFLSLGTTQLDSLSTTGSKTPFTDGKTRTITYISPGVSAMFTVYNVNFGFFTGIDAGFGSNAKNWNFNNKLWIGFGIGYNLSSGFWKK